MRCENILQILGNSWNPYCQVEFRWYRECRLLVGLFGDLGRHEHVSCANSSARYEQGVRCIGRRGWAHTGVLPITVPNALVPHVPPRLPTI